MGRHLLGQNGQNVIGSHTRKLQEMMAFGKTTASGNRVSAGAVVGALTTQIDHRILYFLNRIAGAKPHRVPVSISSQQSLFPDQGKRIWHPVSRLYPQGRGADNQSKSDPYGQAWEHVGCVEQFQKKGQAGDEEECGCFTVSLQLRIFFFPRRSDRAEQRLCGAMEHICKAKGMHAP